MWFNNVLVCKIMSKQISKLKISVNMLYNVNYEVAILFNNKQNNLYKYFHFHRISL